MITSLRLVRNITALFRKRENKQGQDQEEVSQNKINYKTNITSTTHAKAHRHSVDKETS